MLQQGIKNFGGVYMKKRFLMKKISIICIFALLLLSLAGCSGSTQSSTKLKFMGDGVSEAKEYTLKEIKELSAENIYMGSAVTSDTSDEDDKASQIEGVTIVYFLTDVVKLSPDASTVVVCAEDGFRREYPIKDLYAREANAAPAVLVWSEDGKGFNPDNGQPVRFYDSAEKLWIYSVDTIKVK